MRKSILLIVSILLLKSTLIVHGQDVSQFKRVAYKLVIKVDKKINYEENLNETPFVLPGNIIQLYPGEVVFIEVDQIDAVIQTFKAVKEIKDTSKTLIIKFSQILKQNEHEQMMLVITNSFKYKLSYKAHIFLLNQKRWVNSDVYPVEANLSSIETWPDIILSISLDDWIFEK